MLTDVRPEHTAPQPENDEEKKSKLGAKLAIGAGVAALLGGGMAVGANLNNSPETTPEVPGATDENPGNSADPIPEPTPEPTDLAPVTPGTDPTSIAPIEGVEPTADPNAAPVKRELDESYTGYALTDEMMTTELEIVESEMDGENIARDLGETINQATGYGLENARELFNSEEYAEQRAFDEHAAAHAVAWQVSLEGIDEFKKILAPGWEDKNTAQLVEFIQLQNIEEIKQYLLSDKTAYHLNDDQPPENNLQFTTHLVEYSEEGTNQGTTELISFIATYKVEPSNNDEANVDVSESSGADATMINGGTITLEVYARDNLDGTRKIEQVHGFTQDIRGLPSEAGMPAGYLDHPDPSLVW